MWIYRTLTVPRGDGLGMSTSIYFGKMQKRIGWKISFESLIWFGE